MRRTLGRILLGDNTGGGAALLLATKFQRFGVWISDEFQFV